MSTQEQIHCPNCKENVPKTLYCLNCGYPIYKLEQENSITDKEPETSPESEPEPDLDDVDMSVEYEPPQETFMEEETQKEETTELIVEPEIGEPEPTVEPEEPELVEAPALEEPEPEPEEELEPTAEVEKPEPMMEPAMEESEPTVEPEEPMEMEPEPIMESALEEPEPEPIVELVVEDPEPTIEETVEETTPEIMIAEEEMNMMDEVKIEFAPDPLTKEVMENLAKNITLKIRLTKLLRNNAVKEETFKKLFDSYVDQGRLWVSRRDDIITRFEADVERMEEELVSARKDFELLDIRKNIGDASEMEYEVKAPAYKWDIEHLDTEIKNCTGGIQYMKNLQALVPDEEVTELESLAETSYSELDSVEDVTSDTIARMKETLAEALNTLQN